MGLTNKVDFAVIFKVANANPNGDPLNGNRPRVTYDGLGEVTDVCLKRKIRDRLMELGCSIFVQSDDRKTDSCKSLRERAEPLLKKNLSSEETVKLACEEWFDVRAFGQVFAFSGNGKKGKKDKDGDSNGDTGVSIPIRGAVSIHSAFSTAAIDITSTQITKSVNGESNESGKRSSDTMGMKHRVDRGVYVFYGSINPQLAERTGFSDEDATQLKAVLPRLFENDASSARPEGSMSVSKVLWWKHNSKHGQYSSAKVHGSLCVNPEGSYSLANLAGLIPEEIDGY